MGPSERWKIHQDHESEKQSLIHRLASSAALLFICFWWCIWMSVSRAEGEGKRPLIYCVFGYEFLGCEIKYLIPWADKLLGREMRTQTVTTDSLRRQKQRNLLWQTLLLKARRKNLSLSVFGAPWWRSERRLFGGTWKFHQILMMLPFKCWLSLLTAAELVGIIYFLFALWPCLTKWND